MAQQKTPRNLTKDERIEAAELLRERIYSTITVLAVMAILWQHAGEQNALAVIGTIAGTVFALWVSTLVASRMSYRIFHDETELEVHYRKSTQAASGLLAPAVVPIFLIVVSMTGVIELKTAIIAGIISLLLSLFLFSLMSGRKLARSVPTLLLYSALQVGVGLAVVALKLVVK